MSGAGLLNALPVFNGQRDVISQEQTTKDIVNEVLAAHKFFAKDYDNISDQFVGNTPKKLFDFCKQNLPYKIESEDMQTTRSPAGIIALRQSDCKHYSGFIAGVLDSLNRKGITNYNWCYRFASYSVFNKDAKHVFVVIKEPGGGEIWIDPVLDALDQRSPDPFYIKDKTVNTMALVRMSGIPASNYIQSHTIKRRSDNNNMVRPCGCQGNSSSLVQISGFDVSTFIQQNPIPSALIAAGLGYLIFKLI